MFYKLHKFQFFRLILEWRFNKGVKLYIGKYTLPFLFLLTLSVSCPIPMKPYMNISCKYQSPKFCLEKLSYAVNILLKLSFFESTYFSTDIWERTDTVLVNNWYFSHQQQQQKLKSSQNLLKNKYLFSFQHAIIQPAIMDKIFETNSSFHLKQRTTGKAQFLFFRSFLLVSKNILFSEGDRALDRISLKF